MNQAGKLIAPLAGIVSLCLIVLFGACITGLVLKEPDICFLLAGGRWIAEHGQIPASDPFAYNISRDYIVEQWLTELLFFWLWKYTGSLGLLCFDALILTLTFITMPYRLMRLNCIGAGQALLVTTLIAVGAFVHISVRPEIFSVLFVAVYLEIFKRLDLKAAQAEGSNAPQIDWAKIAALALIMALWTNLHILFVGGLMLLALYCGTSFYSAWRGRDQKLNLTAPIALAATTLATLANPYGIGLWLSLPGLMTWPKTNEVKAVGLDSLHDPCCYSFFLMILIAMVNLRHHFKFKGLSAGELFFKAMIPGGIAVGVRAIRAIPMANIMLAASLRPKGNSESGVIDSALANFFDPTFWQILCLGCGMLGAGLMTRIIPPEFPQGSAAFNPPFAAVTFIAKAPPPGNLLNDPHFGNVMMWQMEVDEKFPKLFIDSRYHLFKDAILDDYWTMVLCRQGWQEKLKEYKIAWIFVPTKLQIVQTLSNDPNWKLVYQDETASVLVNMVVVKTSPPQ